MRPEYDFSKGVRGKYVPRMLASATVVVLDSDVAEIYRNSKAVNAALREHAGLTQRARGRRKGTRSAPRTRAKG